MVEVLPVLAARVAGSATAVVVTASAALGTGREIRVGPLGEDDLGGHTSAGVPGTPVVMEARRHPLTGGRYSFGGTRAGNAHARADSWPRVVAFLRDALG
jgi:hypothetical protein